LSIPIDHQFVLLAVRTTLPPSKTAATAIPQIIHFLLHKSVNHVPSPTKMMLTASHSAALIGFLSSSSFHSKTHRVVVAINQEL
jgi:hypothetical protein